MYERKFSFLWDKCQGVQLLSYVSCMFSFLKKLPNCFPEWLHHFTFPPAMFEWSSFSTSLTALVLSRFFFNHRYSDRCVISHFCFNLHSPDGYWCWTSFHGLICHLYTSFGERSVHILCPFVNCVCFIVEFWKLFTYSRRFIYSTHSSFTRYMAWKYYLPLCSLSFHLLHMFSHRTKVFNFDDIYLINFSIYGLRFGAKFNNLPSLKL